MYQLTSIMVASAFRSLVCISLSILLTGCYSYRGIDLDEVSTPADMKYRVELSNGKKYIATPLDLGRDSLIVQYGRIEVPIYRDDILEIEERNFSWGKTIMAVMIPVGGIIILSSILANNIKIDWSSSAE